METERNQDVKYCGACTNFIGGGDFNLCCSKRYDLCYCYTPACNLFEFDEEVFDICKDKLFTILRKLNNEKREKDE